jgi:hypothetical protein
MIDPAVRTPPVISESGNLTEAAREDRVFHTFERDGELHPVIPAKAGIHCCPAEHGFPLSRE